MIGCICRKDETYVDSVDSFDERRNSKIPPFRYFNLPVPSRLVSSSSSLILINFREKAESGRKRKATFEEKRKRLDSAGSMVIRAVDNNSLFRPCGGETGGKGFG